MLKLEKEKTEYGCSNIILKDKDRTLRMCYEGIDSLYWDLDKNSNIDEENSLFVVDPEDEEIYLIFDKLYNRIKECKVFNYSDLFLDALEKEKKAKEETILNSYLKMNDIYSRIFCGGVITWYSDDKHSKEANILKIYKGISGEYILKITHHDKDNNFRIRFYNNGSKYEPFNLIFMGMFEDFQKIQSNNTKSRIRKK